MSTLTKVLIVLLTVFSIFLCGIVVTYVANATNQRERADGLQRQLRSAQASEQDALADLEQQKTEAEQLKADLNEQISQLKVAMSEVQAQLDQVKRDNALKEQEVANQTAAAQLANQTAAKQTELFESAHQNVEQLRGEQTKLSSRLAETDQLLMEKMSIIAQLQEKNRQLVESNQELESRINRVLQQYGRAAAPPQPVTRQRAVAEPATPKPITKDLGLTGKITVVDAKNRLAQISIGTAAGIKQDMKLHIIRGEQFVADIMILDADADKAVGILDLVQLQPKVGDTVTTNL